MNGKLIPDLDGGSIPPSSIQILIKQLKTTLDYKVKGGF